MFFLLCVLIILDNKYLMSNVDDDMLTELEYLVECLRDLCNDYNTLPCPNSKETDDVY